MTIKEVCLFLLLLLSSGTSFSFSNDNQYLLELERLGIDLEFEEEATDLCLGTVPFFKTNILKSDSFKGTSNFVFQSLSETQSQKDYIRRSKKIILSLDVSDIIFPFHVFL